MSKRQLRIERTKSADYSPSPSRVPADAVIYASREYTEWRNARGAVVVEHHRSRSRFIDR